MLQPSPVDTGTPGIIQRCAATRTAEPRAAKRALDLQFDQGWPDDVERGVKGGGIRRGTQRAAAGGLHDPIGVAGAAFRDSFGKNASAFCIAQDNLRTAGAVADELGVLADDVHCDRRGFS